MGGGGLRRAWGGGGGEEGRFGGNMPPRPNVSQSQAPLTSPCPPSNHTITLNLKTGAMPRLALRVPLPPMARV